MRPEKNSLPLSPSTSADMASPNRGLSFIRCLGEMPWSGEGGKKGEEEGLEWARKETEAGPR